MGMKQGQATGTVYTSPAKAKRIRAARRAEEKLWASMAGPVVIRHRDDPAEEPQAD